MYSSDLGPPNATPSSSSGGSSQRSTDSADAARNAIELGARARHLVRAVATVFNPVVLSVAGRRYMPIVGKLYHRGRRSGRLYTTPLGMRPINGGFVMPRTFGQAAHWYRNIIAAGWCVITYRGTDHTVVNPTIVDAKSALAAFPRYERGALRLLGIDEFVFVAAAPIGWTPPSSSAS